MKTLVDDLNELIERSEMRQDVHFDSSHQPRASAGWQKQT